MDILLVQEGSADPLVAALAAHGARVVVAPSVHAARVFLRHELVDALVLPERMGGSATLDLALLAEWRHPLVVTVLLSDRTGGALDEMMALLPSVAAIVPPTSTPTEIVAVTLGAVGSTESAVRRLARRWQEAGGEPLPPSAFYPGGPMAPGPRLRRMPLRGRPSTGATVAPRAMTRDPAIA